MFVTNRALTLTFCLSLTLIGTAAWVVPKRLPNPDVHSPFYLVELANYEQVLAVMLSEFKAEFSQRGHRFPAEFLTDIEEYLDRNMDDSLATQAFLHQSPTNDSAVMIAQNPIFSFKMVWRFAHELRNIRGQFLEYEHELPESSTKAYFSDEAIFSTWPTHEIVVECIVAILRLQMVYDMDAKDLASGIIFGVQTGAKLSIHQCSKIGIFAFTSVEFTSSIPWLELVIEKVDAGEPNDASVRSEDVRIYLQRVTAAHDKSWENKKSWDYFHYTEKLGKNNTVLKLEERIPLRKVDRSSDFRKKHHDYNECNSWSLCSGGNHQTVIQKSELFCWYETKLHPVLNIYPIKTEMLSKSPRILQMYDVIHDTTISHLVKQAKPLLERSQVTDKNAGACERNQKVRTSVEGFVLDQLPKLTKLIEFVTGLHVAVASEPYLVASYAFGGHYDCHLDAFENTGELGNKGNRIATIMFYLENSQEGGFTVFPQAGVAAKPIKGSAVFWYNLKRNGSRDRETHHCACPVILGHKMITTKWIQSDDQFRTRPCTLLQGD